MPQKSPPSKPPYAADSAADPDAIVAAHPQRAELDLLRTTIRSAVPDARGSVKWNAPSFATTEHFATFHLRAKRGVQVVLHLGAKARGDTGLRAAIEDPAGLLEWRGADRAIATFADVADVEAKRAAFAAIVRRWVDFV